MEEGDGGRVVFEFHAYQRVFRLRLQRDASIFANGFEITRRKDTSGPTDVSFLYSGDLQGEPDSFCHGSIIHGLFEGLIQTQSGTFYVEPASRRPAIHLPHNHSIIYREADLDYPSWGVLDSASASEIIHQRLQDFQRKMTTKLEDNHLQRQKRSLDYSKTSCLLHLQADYLFYQRFGSVEAVVAQIASYVRAVNAIYERVEFDGIRNIDFRVKSIDIVDEDFRSETPYISPEMLLMLHAKSNWDDYCLAFLLTDRDYSGVLGIAFNGQPGDAGGICSKQRTFQDKEVSMNTGLITLQKYGQPSPPRMVHITLAHEFGHSLGAYHDESKHCSKFALNTTNGKYLMFGYASDGREFNNDKLSPCSVAFIANILKLKKDTCFVETDRPICGNRIVDPEEECDVGNESEDPCCYGAAEPSGLRCRLKPGALCSPSQGLCCGHACVHKLKGERCQEETDCASESHCSGSVAECPAPLPKANFSLCGLQSQVCLNGLCVGSLCMRHGLEQCDCKSVSLKEKCHLCCQRPGQDSTCAATTSASWEPFFNGSEIWLVPGSPCQDRQGYCDMFHVCRFVDEDGPIARVKNFILNFIELDDIATWMKKCWWIILLAILTLAAMMSATVFLFGRTVDSETEEKSAPSSKKKNSVDWQFQMQQTFLSWEREQIYIEATRQEYETII